MPIEIPAPSNAGPAAVEVACSVPRCQSIISPLVPMSTRTAVFSERQIPEAKSAVEMSAPTNAAAQGGRYTGVSGASASSPISPAFTNSPYRRFA